MNPSSDADGDDYSPSATVITFDHPIPLLRGPIPAGLSDDPSIGPFVLAFRDARIWKSALQACEAKVIEQCEAGIRIGCSISASSKCKPPWWRTLFGGAPVDFAAREQCEEHEMAACLAASKGSCLKLAKDKCLPPFRDARIALSDKEISKFIFWASPSSEARSMISKPVGSSQMPSYLSSKCDLQVTNYRGTDLLESSCGTENFPGDEVSPR
ncbi:PREDICTED: uncharacterized protein LOC104589682 [Nelumbo nucifera]|uniref:Uncharacterized protein LOC104589682 n=2 Tax=Nelumbo nucifera TaxID=4432 RepID=A0A1U7ZEG1_NELNU|nr:PREDICTED: uncharacterized protein LOC104589682 [Nelumbo nucifera]DAD45834.1 TPA_asm: hypothetical protein HUJ06_004064 [Nelumbo nucifera]